MSYGNREFFFDVKLQKNRELSYQKTQTKQALGISRGQDSPSKKGQKTSTA